MRRLMSKILEALKRHPSPPAARPAENRPQTREVQVESQGREWTQERLADIYFSATGKPKTSEPPVIIKVVEKPRLASAIPWIITSVAFLITALSLFSTKRFFVDIRVIDDKTLLRSIEEDADAGLIASPSGEAAPANAPKTLALQDFVFEGGAILQSSKDARRLTLVNSSVSPFSRAILTLPEPLDLSRAKLVFEVRGAKSGENLGVALKDRGNVQAFKKGFLNPFPEGLSTDWRTAEVLLVDLNDNFDPKNIVSVRFEFGAKDTSNRSGDTIYVRDLRVVPLS